MARREKRKDGGRRDGELGVDRYMWWSARKVTKSERKTMCDRSGIASEVETRKPQAVG